MLKNSLKKAVKIIGIGALIIGLAGCGTQAGMSSGPTQAVKVGKVASQTVEGDISLSGVFDAESNATVTTQLPGKVQTLNAAEGSSVKQGDVLITLDQSDLQNALAQAQLGVQQAQADLNKSKLAYDNDQTTWTRDQQLLASGAIAQSDFDNITMKRDLDKTTYETVLNVELPAYQEKVNSVQLSLAKTTIVSPIDGVVAACNIKVGDNVSPGVPLISVVSANNPVLVGNVSEDVLDRLQVGQAANVSADTLSGSKFAGKISFLSPVSVPTGQFFPLKITVQDPKGQLKPGMTGTAAIPMKINAAAAVPNTALFRRDGKYYVYAVKDGKAVRTAVTLGFQGDKETEISEGLTAGDTIVTQGTDGILSGMKIPA